jgi:hypothetical protein
MKKTLLSLLAIGMLAVSPLMAQKNVVKVKPVRPIANIALGGPLTLPLQVERVIIPRLTVALNFSYTIPSTLDFGQLELGNISVPTIKGFGIGPEVRFYPNVTKDTPRGLYLMGFLNYRTISVESQFNNEQLLEFGDITTPTGNVPLEIMYESKFDLTGKWSALTYGLGWGTQWLIANRVSIDVLWLGFGWGAGTASFDITGPLIDVNQINNSIQTKYGADPRIPAGTPLPTIPASDPNIPTWQTIGDNFSADLDGSLSDIPVLSPSLTSRFTANGAGLDLKSNVPVIRAFNISLGFAF